MANGVRSQNDVFAIASKNQNSISVMTWNYHDDNMEGEPVSVEIAINGVDASKVLVQHYRVDDHFSNSFERWKAMGKSQQVTSEQYRELEKAGQLQLYTSPEWQSTNAGRMTFTFDLPRQGVSLIQLTW